MNNIVYIIPIILFMLLMLILIYVKQSQKNNMIISKSIRGKGKIEKCCSINENADILDFQTKTQNGKPITIVSFEDGYTFTTNYCKTQTNIRLKGIHYEYVFDQAVKDEIIQSAKTQHTKDALKPKKL